MSESFVTESFNGAEDNQPQSVLLIQASLYMENLGGKEMVRSLLDEAADMGMDAILFGGPTYVPVPKSADNKTRQEAMRTYGLWMEDGTGTVMNHLSMAMHPKNVYMVSSKRLDSGDYAPTLSDQVRTFLRESEGSRFGLIVLAPKDEPKTEAERELEGFRWADPMSRMPYPYAYRIHLGVDSTDAAKAVRKAMEEEALSTRIKALDKRGAPRRHKIHRSTHVSDIKS